MLALIHDGFGKALEHWARERSSGPKEALALLSAGRGETYNWLLRDEPEAARKEFHGSESTPVTLTNLRWRDCQVSASFQQVVFANCDFRGTRFRNCRFRGVVLVNCLLDGAMFEECAIVGSTNGEPSPTPDRPPRNLRQQIRLFDPADEAVTRRDRLPEPDFCIPVRTDAILELRRYREATDADEGDEQRFLYSRTSGLAAVPWKPQYGGGQQWHRTKGGLTMRGGRLSSLMIRRCTFQEDGVLDLHQIAGSSLDVVEQGDAAAIKISDSTIRGLTVTRPVSESGSHTERSSDGGLAVDVTNSAVANVWFGDGLKGHVRFKECKLWQVCNTSDREALEVEIRDSRHHGLVNVARPDEQSREAPGYGPERIDEREELVRDVQRMDYRSVPAKLELTGEN